MGVGLGYRQSPDHIAKRMASRIATLRARPKEVGRGWLQEHYWEKSLDCVQIGKMLSRDQKTVWAWLKHYGIPMRPRGHNAGQLPRGRAPGFRLQMEHRMALRRARIADGHVPYLRGGRHWLSTVPRHSHPNWKGGLTPERQRFYSTLEWRAAVKKVWGRAEARCERCGVHHNTAERRGTFHIHHIISFAVRELRCQLRNLVLLCQGCHRWVHSNANVKKELLEVR